MGPHTSKMLPAAELVWKTKDFPTIPTARPFAKKKRPALQKTLTSLYEISYICEIGVSVDR